MTQKEREEEKKRLVELLSSMSYFAPKDYINRLDIDWCADYLLSHGAIMPPCKLGDIIYEIPSPKIYDWNINMGYPGANIVDESRVVEIRRGEADGCVRVWNGDPYSGEISLKDSDFRKTWFLNRVEAEAALERMRAAYNAEKERETK